MVKDESSQPRIVKTQWCDETRCTEDRGTEATRLEAAQSVKGICRLLEVEGLGAEGEEDSTYKICGGIEPGDKDQYGRRRLETYARRGPNRKPLRLLLQDVGHPLRDASPVEFALAMIVAASGKLVPSKFRSNTVAMSADKTSLL